MTVTNLCNLMLKGKKHPQYIQARNKWKAVAKKGVLKCGTCEQEKPLSEFSVATHQHKSSYTSYCRNCKKCTNAIDTNRRRHSKKSVSNSIKSICSRLCVGTRFRSTKFNRPFNLDNEFLMDLYTKQEGKCFYTKKRMQLPGEGLDKDMRMSIDRVDSSGGYTKDNVVFCCWAINRMKSDLSVDNFVEWAQLVINNSQYKQSSLCQSEI